MKVPETHDRWNPGTRTVQLEDADQTAEWCGGFARHQLGGVLVAVPTPEGLINAFPGDRIVCEAGDFRVERRSA